MELRRYSPPIDALRTEVAELRDDDDDGGDSPLAAVTRIAAGEPRDGDLQWFARGCAAWVLGRGAVPLERCLQLPRNDTKLRRAERDLWLVRAARGIDAIGGARRLRDEISAVERCHWRLWREEPVPPEGTSELRGAIFHALRLGDGAVLSRRQLQRIAGHVWGSRCPATSPTVDAFEDANDAS